MKLADGLRGVEYLPGLGNSRQHLFREEWKLDEFPAIGPLRCAAESGHTLRYISLEADPALFAITGDVDASLMLFVEHIGDTLLDRFRNFRLVKRPASFVVNEQCSEFFAARQATNMRYQNAINALLHETLRRANSS